MILVPEPPTLDNALSASGGSPPVRGPMVALREDRQWEVAAAVGPFVMPFGKDRRMIGARS
jgi:hypothetical protein